MRAQGSSRTALAIAALLAVALAGVLVFVQFARGDDEGLPKGDRLVEHGMRSAART